MKTLFYTSGITVILSILFLTITLGNEYNNMLKKIIFKYIIRFIAIIFLFLIGGCILHLEVIIFIFYIIFCIAVFTLCIGIEIFNDDDETGVTLAAIGLIFTIVGAIGVCTINFNTEYNKLPEKEIILSDYDKNNLANDENIIVIEISEEDKNTKSFAIQKYKISSDIKLPFYFNEISKYEVNKSEENKIVISSVENIELDLLSLFNIRVSKKTKKNEYTLYIKSEDILYNWLNHKKI